MALQRAGEGGRAPPARIRYGKAACGQLWGPPCAMVVGLTTYQSNRLGLSRKAGSRYPLSRAYVVNRSIKVVAASRPRSDSSVPELFVVPNVDKAEEKAMARRPASRKSVPHS